ncbi:MAG TPA: Com family DNA-binding transcriptional regulator [Solidesulfovibrio magneticus]|nr:Com family DNA-binding transcriptional regulator [Solidesulfovibrio magneticus]
MEIRCGQCGRLLAKGTGTIEIKCPRCRTINHVRAASPEDSPERADKECSRGPTAL